jgi:hypothetical protein
MLIHTPALLIQMIENRTHACHVFSSDSCTSPRQTITVVILGVSDSHDVPALFP